MGGDLEVASGMNREFNSVNAIRTCSMKFSKIKLNFINELILSYMHMWSIT